MNRFIKNGNFTPFIRGVFCLVGVSITLIGLKYDSSLITCYIGFVIGAIGGVSSQSAMFKIKPFDNNYLNARSTYDDK
jgi:hypothetical protein